MTYQDEPAGYIPEKICDEFACNSCGCRFGATYTLTDIDVHDDLEESRRRVKEGMYGDPIIVPYNFRARITDFEDLANKYGVSLQDGRDGYYFDVDGPVWDDEDRYDQFVKDLQAIDPNGYIEYHR